MDGLLGGVLPALYSGADQFKRRVKSLLGDPVGFMGGLNEDAKTAQDQRRAQFFQDYGRDVPGGLLGQSDPAWVQQQADLGRQQMMDAALAGLTVWHGSPHKFAPTPKNPLGEFDPTKIGTGEGAQAYSHGHYLAEVPAVAKGYGDILAMDKDPRQALNGFIKYLSDNFPPQKINKALVKEWLGTTQQFSKLAGNDEFVEHVSIAVRGRSPNGTVSQGSLRSYEALDKFFPKMEPQLYKVDLSDDAIPKMLDWDKPLKKQPEILAKLKNYAAADDPSITGGQFYRKLIQEMGADPAEVSAALRADGIPGVRYLDGNSRVTSFDPRKSGTRNFVVFPGEEGLLQILERNGQGLLGVK